MKRMKIEIMGISKIRSPDSGDIEKERHTIFYSGLVEERFEHGVVIIHYYIIEYETKCNKLYTNIR
jgi:hypothetical protein